MQSYMERFCGRGYRGWSAGGRDPPNASGSAHSNTRVAPWGVTLSGEKSYNILDKCIYTI